MKVKARSIVRRPMRDDDDSGDKDGYVYAVVVSVTKNKYSVIAKVNSNECEIWDSSECELVEE